MALNTNKSGHHVIRYNWHIVENGIKRLNATFNNMSVITYKMVISFIGV
jgi:hypothetical protein